MKIAIGADHRGFVLKEILKKTFGDIEWFDCGASDKFPSNYPIFAKAVCNEIVAGRVAAGILICGSGIGMSIAANRYRGIFAALCWCKEVAKAAKEDDNSNVLVLPADFVGDDVGEIVKSWRDAQFKGSKYKKRLFLIDE